MGEKFAEKKTQSALHLETARQLLRYGAFAVEKYAQQVSHAA